MEAMMIKPQTSTRRNATRSINLPMRDHTRRRSRTRGAASSTCTTSCSRNAASSCGSATTGRQAARGCSRRGRCTSALARLSSRTSRTAWRGSSASRTSMDRASVSPASARRLHGALRADAQPQFRHGHRRRRRVRRRNYDTIYTERYLGLPKTMLTVSASSPSSRRQSHGQLLLIHSALDDNVHLRTHAVPTTAARGQAVSDDDLSQIGHASAMRSSRRTSTA